MIATLKQWAARTRAFFRSQELDHDVDQELESYLVMLVDDNVRRGMPPGAARREALIRIGSRTSLAEQQRDARGLPGVDALLNDLRLAFRLLAKERRVSAAAIVTLALGIGVNTVGFTIVNVAFFRGLPFADSGRLYSLSLQTRQGRRARVSYAELRDWRDQNHSFIDLAGFSDATMNISDDRALPEQVQGTWLTGNTFGVLGQQPLLGRDFTPGDDRRGADPVVIIGYSLWKDRYGADPKVLGTSLRLNGRPAAIIAVMPDGMRFPDSTSVWAPYVPPDAQERRDVRSLDVLGRLKDGAVHREAHAELNGIAQRLATTYPDINSGFVGVRVEPLTERFVGGLARKMFLTIMAAVSFVLLIACANVANLLLSRSASRAREIAIRLALGATRWRVVRQLLVESLVLGVLGGGLGLLFAAVGVRVFEAAMGDSGKPYWMVFAVDSVVFGYVAAICVLTAILFGLAPALHVSKANTHDLLKDGGRGSTGSRRVRWFSSAMVVAELALTLVLLAGAGLMIRSFMKLYTVDIGIATEHLMAMRLQLPETKYATADARRAFFTRLEPRLAAIPGVGLSAVTSGVPPFDGGERLLEIDNGARTSAPPQFVSVVIIGSRFFEVVDRPLVRGRGFREEDGAPGSDVIIINERLAAQFFPGEDPIGRRLRFTQRQPTRGQPPAPWRTVVGISGPIRHGSLQDAYLNAVVYIPYRQEAPDAVALLIRSELPPASVMGAVRREVQAIDQDQPVFTIQTLEQMMMADRWPSRVFGSVLALLAVIALVLSSMGLYAVMAYSVTQRTHEIGVRMALGAERRQVSWLILKRGLMQLAVGLPLGLVGGLALGVALQRTLTVTPGDPLTFLAITILLIIVSIAACLVPTRSATRVDPLVALRAE